MNRQELIAKAKEMNLVFERPVNQIKSEVIEAAITAATETIEVHPPELKQRGRKKSTDGSTIREQIIALGKTGLTKTQIFNKLVIEHSTLNYRYVVQTLIKEGIKVPRQKRVFEKKTEEIVPAT